MIVLVLIIRGSGVVMRGVVSVELVIKRVVSGVALVTMRGVVTGIMVGAMIVY